MVNHMTEKEKQLYQAAKNTFNSWPKWKQESVLDFMNAYKEELKDPRCNKCMYEMWCTRDKDLDHKCPHYKRDMPDGGYYG